LQLLPDGLVVLERPAEVALGGVADPLPVADQERLVEPQFSPALLDLAFRDVLILTKAAERITRSGHQAEHEKTRHHDEWNRDGQTPKDEAPHGRGL
jgi:hypothetical protein